MKKQKDDASERGAYRPSPPTGTTAGCVAVHFEPTVPASDARLSAIGSWLFSRGGS